VYVCDDAYITASTGRLINVKGCGRKRLWPVRATVAAFV